MAYYKVADTQLDSIVDAINTKAGTTGKKVFPTEFVSGIQAISTGTDVSDTTATESDVLSGKYFHKANGTKVQGSIATKTSSDVTVNNNVVTIQAGYYASQVQKTVGTAQAAQTITPTTSDQTIASGKYLTGTQTIKGDANLIAGNIKKGVTIFGITGTYEGDSPTPSTITFYIQIEGRSYEFTADDGMTWAEWVISEYNNISSVIPAANTNARISGHNIYFDYDDLFTAVIYYGGSNELDTNEIVEGRTYIGNI